MPNNSPEQRKREKKNNDALNQKTKTNSHEAFFRSLLERETQESPQAAHILAVFEGERAVVALGDLATWNKANAGSGGFGRKERNEQVRRVRKAGPFVFDDDFDMRLPAERPRDAHAAAGFERGIGGVAHQIDQELFDLVRIRWNDGLRARCDSDREARLQARTRLLLQGCSTLILSTMAWSQGFSGVSFRLQE